MPVKIEKPIFGIRPSGDGTHFVDSAGKPFFWLGDTAWPLFTDYSEKQARTYIAARAEQGFTVIQSIFARGLWNGGSGEELRPTLPNPRGARPWGDSPAEPNPEFFDYAAELIEYAGSLGVAIAVIPTWGYYVVENPQFDEPKARAYGEFIGRRLGDKKNLIWFNGGDRLPQGYEPIWRALAHGLREGEGRQPMTYHPTGCHSSSYFFHEEEWLDFNLIQTWASWMRIHSMIVADRLRLPAKPVVLGEPAYEDGPEYPTGPITPWIVRKQAWLAYMAGGGFTYGHNSSWRMEGDWMQCLDSPGARQMGVFREIAQAWPWWRSIPDQSLLPSAPGSTPNLTVAARTIDRTQALIYVPEPGFVSFCIDRIAAPRVQLTWIDPRNGKRVEAGSLDTTNERGQIFPAFEDVRTLRTPAFFEDSLLSLVGF